MSGLAFSFACVAERWHEVKYLDSVYFEEFLSSNIQLFNYSNDVEHIIFGFYAISKFSLEARGGIKPTKFFAKKKLIEGDILLDFPAMLNAQSEEESRQLQAEGYLRFLESLQHHRRLKKADFNAQKPYEDTKNLFEKEGWVKKGEEK